MPPASVHAWDDAQYLRFADERTRPSHDLLARVALDDAAVRCVVDLGCGPGNSTALLHARWPQARVIGVDSSPQMLAAARRDLPALQWLQADVADVKAWQPAEPVDVLFANALLQWLPDHATLLPALLAVLRPGGVLAVQMPCNHDEPSHRLMRELPGPWQAVFAAQAVERPPVGTPAAYHDILAPLAASVDTWLTTYQHVLADAQAIVEWVKGTGLRPYLQALPDEAMRQAYLAAYTAGVDAAYPVRRDGKRLFPFPRLFIVARRPG